MIKFGTGGWRAIIGDGFTKANIRLFARAMADKLLAEGVADRGIVLGYDRRFLSKETVQWSCEVLAAAGIRCLFVCRSVPTPLIMNHVMKYGLPYGMMVTASHNPSLYNGIKVFTQGGRDADEVQTADIEAYIRRAEGKPIPTLPYAEARARGLVEEFYPMNEYLDDIMGKVDMQAIREAGLRIVYDPMYGVGQTPLTTILTTGRCDLKVIHQEHDTLFGGRMPAPSEELLYMLRSHVVDLGYDLGLATDGDADRLGVIDDLGNYLSPNDILVLLYHYLLAHKGWRGSAVRNLATTHRLDAVARDFGQVCYEVPVGFKHISAKMAETGAILGGESSGGLTVAGHIPGKDGMYAASLLVEMVAVTGKKLSQLMAGLREKYGSWQMAERSLAFDPDLRPGLEERIFLRKEVPELEGVAVERVSYLDGCKLCFQNGGWAIIRFSGTEPLLRVFCEMPTRREADRVCDLLRAFCGI